MLDTNILVSMIFFPSVTTSEFEKAITNGYRVVLCDYVILELDTAVIEDIDVFVTGDQDFHNLDIDCPKIMTMREFLDAI